MDTKLTLKLNHTVIMKAKSYAKEQNTSLSRLIENYLHSITEETLKKQHSNISPLVKSLSGIVSLPNDFDFKKSYADHLSEKYK